MGLFSTETGGGEAQVPLSAHPLARQSFVMHVVLWPVGRDIFQEPRTNRNFLMTLDLELLG